MFKTSIILITVLLSSAIFAQSKVVKKNNKRRTRMKKAVDSAHLNISNRIERFSDNIDAFFANEKHEGEPNRSKLKLSFRTYFREARGPYVVPDINYQLVLPRTEKSLRLVFENENDDQESETSESTAARTETDNEEDNSTAAGIRYMVEKSGIQFSTDSGILVNVPPVVFWKFRAKKKVKFTEWILKIDEQVKWVSGRGFTSDLDLDFDKRLTRKMLLRMVNNTFWNDQDYIIRFENGPSLFQKIDNKRALSYHAHVVSVNEPSFVVDNYILQMTYRHRLYSNWLFMSLTPYVHFPRSENFHRTPGLVLRFDTIFGSI